ncbi:DUF1016 family protein [candidate division KSB1 bacterium]|nr:DUF1016 family protein [candidate division KSB1 bacterium]MBL7093976.1 DUF1016 family protein [candidate division KSB1 bacterium]
MTKNKLSKSTKLPAKFEGYDDLLRDVKSIIEKGLSRVYQAVDNLKVQTYWQVGERIVREELAHKERAGYGKRVAERLAIDLNFSESNIWRMVQFYRTYPILASVMRELSWTHYIYLIIIQNQEERRFYEIQTTLNRWSNGFAFMARQQKVLIADQWEKIDLLFYHVLLKCYVIVDLKARELKRGDVEQVTRYLTYFRDHKTEGDRDPIALIICQSHKRIDVYYSAGKDRDDIFVAEYKTKLPSEEEIKKKLKKLK